MTRNRRAFARTWPYWPVRRGGGYVLSWVANGRDPERSLEASERSGEAPDPGQEAE